MPRERLEAVAARHHAARPVVDGSTVPDRGRDPLADHVGRRVHQHPRLVRYGLTVTDRWTYAAASGASRGREPERRGADVGHPVQAQRAPVVPVEVEGEQVPPAAGRHELVRLHAPYGRLATGRRVGQLDPDPVAGRPREREQGVGVHLDAPALERRDRVVHGADLGPQPRGQHLVELGQRPHRGLAGPGDRAAGGQAERDGGGDGLLVVEQQRRQGHAGPQLVAAADALRRVDRVAEGAQPLDVPAHAAGGHPEPVGQLGAGPHGSLLQQRQQPEDSFGGVTHAPSHATDSGPILSARRGTVVRMTTTTDLHWNRLLLDQLDSTGPASSDRASTGSPTTSTSGSRCPVPGTSTSTATHHRSTSRTPSRSRRRSRRSPGGSPTSSSASSAPATRPTSAARRPTTSPGRTRDRGRSAGPARRRLRRWVEGVRGLGEEGLARPCGPAEGPYADEPLARWSCTSTAR